MGFLEACYFFFCLVFFCLFAYGLGFLGFFYCWFGFFWGFFELFLFCLICFFLTVSSELIGHRVRNSPTVLSGLFILLASLVSCGPNAKTLDSQVWNWRKEISLQCLH